jgi:hypothetical protein
MPNVPEGMPPKVPEHSAAPRSPDLTVNVPLVIEEILLCAEIEVVDN